MESKETKCPNCSKIINSPLYFSCTHIFCPFCYMTDITNTIKYLDFDRTQGVTCTCNICKVGKSKYECKKLINFFINNQYKYPICQKHNKFTTVYCKECKIHLCDDCLNLFHNFYFKDHVITNQPDLNNKNKLCENHNKSINFICEDCIKGVCSDCLSKEHIKHNYIEIDEILKRVFKSVKFSDYSIFKDYLNSREVEMRDNINNEYQKNLNLIDKVIERLKELKKHYIEKVEEFYAFVSDLSLIFKLIYYFYFISLNSNDIEKNPILINFFNNLKKKLPEDNNNKTLNRNVIKFLNLYVIINQNSFSLEKIQQFINDFSQGKECFDCKLSYVCYDDKERFYIEKKEKINSILELLNEAIAIGTQSGILYEYSMIYPYKKISSIKSHEESINCMLQTFFNDNEHIITCSNDKTIKIYKREKKGNIFIKTLKGHKGIITTMISVSINNNSDVYIISGSGDFNIKIWSMKDLKYVRTLTGHKGKISKIEKTNTNYIISAGEDKNIILWDLSKFSLSKTFNFSDFDPITNILFYNENKVLIIRNQGVISSFNVDEELIEKEIGKVNDKVNVVMKLLSRGLIIVCYFNKAMMMYGINNLSFHSANTQMNEPISAITFYRDFTLVTGSQNGEVIIWQDAY